MFRKVHVTTSFNPTDFVTKTSKHEVIPQIGIRNKLTYNSNKQTYLCNSKNLISKILRLFLFKVIVISILSAYSQCALE